MGRPLGQAAGHNLTDAGRHGGGGGPPASPMHSQRAVFSAGRGAKDGVLQPLKDTHKRPLGPAGPGTAARRPRESTGVRGAPHHPGEDRARLRSPEATGEGGGCPAHPGAAPSSGEEGRAVRELPAQAQRASVGCPDLCPGSLWTLGGRAPACGAPGAGSPLVFTVGVGREGTEPHPAGPEPRGRRGWPPVAGPGCTHTASWRTRLAALSTGRGRGGPGMGWGRTEAGQRAHSGHGLAWPSRAAQRLWKRSEQAWGWQEPWGPRSRVGDLGSWVPRGWSWAPGRRAALGLSPVGSWLQESGPPGGPGCSPEPRAGQGLHTGQIPALTTEKTRGCWGPRQPILTWCE